MPQMAPMSWIFISLTVFTTLYLVSISLHYSSYSVSLSFESEKLDSGATAEMLQ